MASLPNLNLAGTFMATGTPFIAIFAISWQGSLQKTTGPEKAIGNNVPRAIGNEIITGTEVITGNAILTGNVNKGRKDDYIECIVSRWHQDRDQ